MKRIVISLFAIVLPGLTMAAAQTPPKADAPDRSVVPIKEGTETYDIRGEVIGRRYTNRALGFEVAFPDEWLIPGDDFEDHMLSQGFDLGLKPPDNLGGISKLQLERVLDRVRILLTAYRSMPGSDDNAIVRISAESLSHVPAVRDAVDYFDLMRSQFAAMSLPADMKYSETQAEQLGKQQFGFLDTRSNAGKKRMYATVRKGVAVMFTISYTKDADLATLRDVLAGGNFALK
jgi:hypothetical protein